MPAYAGADFLIKGIGMAKGTHSDGGQFDSKDIGGKLETEGRILVPPQFWDIMNTLQIPDVIKTDYDELKTSGKCTARLNTWLLLDQPDLHSMIRKAPRSPPPNIMEISLGDRLYAINPHRIIAVESYKTADKFSKDHQNPFSNDESDEYGNPYYHKVIIHMTDDFHINYRVENNSEYEYLIYFLSKAIGD